MAVPVLYYLGNLCWCGAMAAQLICNQWVAGSTPVTSSKNKRTDDENKSPVRFLFAEKASETACAAAAGGQICEWISVDVSGDFCGQRTKTMQEMRKRNAQEGLYRENSEKRPMLSAEIAKSS